MALEMYGIKNCDTVKKARAWLESHGIDYTFHDYKAEGADPGLLRAWCAAQGWESILNRSGMTFRKLDPKETAGLDADGAVALMLAHPSAIKRPILAGGKRLLVGFKPESYAAELG